MHYIIKYTLYSSLTRKVSASGSESVAHRGHGHNDMEIVGAFVDEELPDALPGRSRTSLSRLATHLENKNRECVKTRYILIRMGRP